ncbi:hypothetical protein PG987_013506 [Apiospora arundinis]
MAALAGWIWKLRTEKPSLGSHVEKLAAGGARLKQLRGRNGALEALDAKVAVGFHDGEPPQAAGRPSQGPFARDEEGLLDVVAGVQAMQPGEDERRVRQRLAGGVVERGGNIGGVDFVERQGARLEASVLVGREEQGALSALVLAGGRGRRRIRLLHWRWPRGTDGNVLVGDRGG